MRADGSIEISHVNTLHSLFFAYSPMGISRVSWQRWPTGEAVETAYLSPNIKAMVRKAVESKRRSSTFHPYQNLWSSLGVGCWDSPVKDFSLGTEPCLTSSKIKLKGDQPCKFLQPTLMILFVWKVTSVPGTPLWGISCQLYKWTIKQPGLQSYLS